MIPPIAIMEIPKAVTIGRILGGEQAVKTTTAPLKRPDAASPAIVLPAMIILIDFARAQTRFPSSKMVMNPTYVYC